MVCTVAKGTSANYYIGSQVEYFTGGIEPKGTWIAPFPLFQMENGLPIENDVFERLHAGKASSGVMLCQNAEAFNSNRVGAYDLTFSAPKSVSILWALADTELRAVIEVSQDLAVRDALDVLNRHAAFSRRGHGGLTLEPVLTFGASFQHGESRPTQRLDGSMGSDPQLHTHAVIFNWSRRHDGTFGALDGRHIYQWKMALGAAYRLTLARQLQTLGFRIEVNAETGLFEIAGVDRRLIKEFSQRRTEIETKMDALGVASAEAPALAAEVTRASRKSKRHDLSPNERDELWADRAETLGVRRDILLSQCQTEAQQADRPPITREDLNGQILNKLTKDESLFQLRDVYREAATAAVLHHVATPLVQIVNGVLDDARLVELSRDKLGRAIYSTRELVEIERDIALMAKRAPRGQKFQIPQNLIEREFARCSLSDEQKYVVGRATEKDSIVICEGRAGAGKSTTLTSITSLYRARGFRVIGCATAWRVAAQLATDCQIEARATASWLTMKSFLDDRTVLIVDEAGQLSSRQMHQVLAAARTAKAKIILCGDRRQLQAIGAGSGLKIVAEQIGVARLDTIQRQRHEWMREAVAAFSEGRAADGLGAMASHQQLHWQNTQKSTVSEIVERWAQVVTANPAAKTLILAKSNREVSMLNDEVRIRLRQVNALGREDVLIRGRQSRHDLLAVAVGDNIRFQRRCPGIGVINGTFAVVNRVEPDGNGHARLQVRVENRTFQFSTRQISDVKGRVPITHAYASTIYSAQGMTVDHSFLLGSPMLSSNEAYVACSRSRESTEVFFSRNVVDAAIRSTLNANERKTVPIRDEQRFTEIAHRWSREQEKAVTLDLVDKLLLMEPLSKPRKLEYEPG